MNHPIIQLNTGLPFAHKEDIEVLRETFAKDCYVKISNLFDKDLFSSLRKETFSLLERKSKRKDFIMVETNKTKRHLTTVSGTKIHLHSELIPTLYAHKKIINFLSGIADEALSLTPDLADRHAIHRMHQEGDTHGGHVDDYAFVLIICIEAPHLSQGGEVEFVPNSIDINDLGTDKARRDTLNVGDAYFMRSNKAVHRVLPLKETTNRTVVVFTYADIETKDINVSYSSASLYD